MTELLSPSDAVARALDGGAPMVALETSVVAQGLPHPTNLRAARAMEEAIGSRGAVPAWVWVDRGQVRLGATADELERLGSGNVAKVARRDLPAAVASGWAGATTVSATVWAAHRAGIEMAATGGIGGVHVGGGDVSADLLELCRTPVTLVCSGPKSILDPEATLERLEQLGVAVVGYRCDRLPYFLVRETDLPLEHRVETPEEAASVARARRELGLESSLLVCNPVPEGRDLGGELVGRLVEDCLREAAQAGISGKLLTPFLLDCLAVLTDGASVSTNVALLESNAALAADIAAALSR